MSKKYLLGLRFTASEGLYYVGHTNREITVVPYIKENEGKEEIGAKKKYTLYSSASGTYFGYGPARRRIYVKEFQNLHTKEATDA